MPSERLAVTNDCQYDHSMNNQLASVERFHELHSSGCFVLPNPFDVGSAKYLHHLGFQALATTSAGFAFTQGLPDGGLSLAPVLKHLHEIVQATPLPVNADFQNGYADDPEGVADSVKRCVATGVAGLSIEDSTGERSQPLYEKSQAIERIIAARQAIDESGIPVVLTARCESALVGVDDAFAIALERLPAFAAAGADCLYAPGFTDPEQIKLIIEAVAPKPVNVLVHRPDLGLSVAKLAELGVRRISVGSALARVAWRAFIQAAKKISEAGEFDNLAGPPFEDLNGLFSGKS